MKKLLLVILFTMFPVLAHGATYYVAQTGSNSNSCASAQSQSTPKLTIDAGIGCLSGGDTLIVKSGVYSETINDNIPSGSAGSPTTIRSEVKGGAILRPTGKAGDGVAFILIGLSGQRSFITLDGFLIDGVNSSAPASGVTVRSPTGDDTTTTNGISLLNLEIKNLPFVDSPNGTNGISIAAGTSDLTLRNNYVHDIGMNAPSNAQFLSYCMYWSGRTSTVEDNNFGPCSGYGIHGFHNQSLGASGGGSNTIRNNYIHDNGAIGLLMCPGNNKIYGNIIVNNGWHPRDPGGMQLGGFCSGVQANNNQVYNNTLYRNKPYCIRLGVSSSASANDNTIRNNICWQNSSDAITVANGTGNTIDRNLLGQSPLFVNAAAGDFHLQNGSPAIDAGVVMPGLSFNGSAPDLGALETGTGGQLPAPTNLRLVGN
jgi:hypothetical protein